jgi:hypothetical protein
MRPRPHNQGRAITAVRSQINVTPLVDVCLVLLIIFMVVTPLLRSAVEVAFAARVCRLSRHASRSLPHRSSRSSAGTPAAGSARIPTASPQNPRRRGGSNEENESCIPRLGSRT